jgi:pre-mRNA-splicing factor 18
VTSIGIHERSSREKISHATGMNAGGAAHIMNDEATRKYLQVSSVAPPSLP